MNSQSIYLSVCLYVCLSVCLFVCQYIYLFSDKEKNHLIKKTLGRLVNNELGRPLPVGKKKDLIWLMKDKLGAQIMT